MADFNIPKDTAQFLEASIETALRGGAQKMAVLAIYPNGDVMQGYHNCQTEDKWQMIGAIGTNALLHVIAENKAVIRELLKEESTNEE